MGHASRLVPALFTLLFCIVADPTAAAPAQRPRVGLVLSGGGARGFAHLGVLRRLEELRVPVDAIAGVSMGGLVGAVYALGYDAAETDRIVSGFDWDDLLRAEPPYPALIFRRKLDRRAFPNDLELGLRGGLASRGALGTGHAIGLFLDRLTFDYGTVGSFDALPIPLRCLAVDLETGAPVVLADGPLSVAVSATIAAPGFLAPVPREGRLLVDGGLVNNLPVDVARDMGADIIIAVDAGTPLLGRGSLRSMGAVLSQAVGVMTLAKVEENRADADVAIILDLGAETSLDFGHFRAIAERGYEVSADAEITLSSLALSAEDYARHREERRGRQAATVAAPRTLVVEATDGRRVSEDVAGELSELSWEPFSIDNVAAELDRLAGSGRYARLGFGVRASAADGDDDPPAATAPQLVVRVEEKSYGPPFLLAGVDVRNTGADRVDFVLAGRLTYVDFGGLGVEWRTTAEVGSRVAIESVYDRPVLGRFLRAMARVDYRDAVTDLYDDGERVARYRTRRAGFALGVGTELGRWGELRASIGLDDLESAVELGEPSFDSRDGLLGTTEIRARVDTRDNPVVPHRGFQLDVRASRYFRTPARRTASQLELRAAGFRPVTGRATGALFAGAGTTPGRDALETDLALTLGGPLHLSAFNHDELRARHTLYGGLGGYYRLADLPGIVGDALYAAGFYEFGSAYDAADLRPWHQGVTVGALLETQLGPLFIGGAWGDGDRSRFLFTLGHLF